MQTAWNISLMQEQGGEAVVSVFDFDENVFAVNKIMALP